jgi:hypothetical protein
MCLYIWIVLVFYASVSLGFWTPSLVRNSKYKKTKCFGNWICFRPQVREGRRLLYWVPYRELMAVPRHTRLVAGYPRRWPGFEPDSSHVGSVVERAALGQVFSEYFGFPCHSFSPLIAAQSSPSIMQGWYNRPIHFRSNSRLAFPHQHNEGIQTNKQTPWPLVRERTIPTERPPLIDEI